MTLSLLNNDGDLIICLLGSTSSCKESHLVLDATSVGPP